VIIALPAAITPNMNTIDSIMFLAGRALGRYSFTITINNIRETVTTGSAITRSLRYDEKRKGKLFLGIGIKKEGDSVTALIGTA
jgi:hypothetical protein